MGNEFVSKHYMIIWLSQSVIVIFLKSLYFDYFRAVKELRCNFNLLDLKSFKVFTFSFRDPVDS